MRDPNFERTVVLVCHFDEGGAIGLVINREGPVSLGEVTEKMELGAPRDPNAMTLWGGPVETGAGFVVFEGDIPVDEGWPLGSVAVSPSSAWLARLVEEGRIFHLCLGYAGWGPGQLDEEIQTGSWLFCDLDPSLIFEAPLAARYDLALASLGLTTDRVWMQPVDE